MKLGILRFIRNEARNGQRAQTLQTSSHYKTMSDPPKISFTFSKQKKSLSLSTPIAGSSSSQKQKESIREYVTSIEDNVIQSEKEPEKPLIIPLIQSRNGIRKRMQLKSLKTESHPIDELTQQALQELKQEALDTSENVNSTLRTSPIAIPLSNFDKEQDKLDDVNYDAVPVDKFGLAVLAGMGFNPEELKKNTGEILGPIRPKGLGLGADPKAVQAVKNSAEQTTKEQLMWKVGAKCQVVLGKHQGKYGTVNGVDGDTGRVIVKFTISKEIVPILQPTIRLVSDKEYAQYANCINQDEVNRYKAEEAVRQQPAEQRLRETDPPSPHSSSDSHNGYSSNGSFKRTREREEYWKATKKSSHSSRSKQRAVWVRPNLLVKFLDRHYADGRYYKHKLTVLEVQDNGLCRCRTDNGSVLNDINSKYLQTVVPHSNNVKVMIVDGPRAGEMARLMNQDPKYDEVDLRTRAGTMIQLSYDQVCAVSEPS